MNTYAIAQGNIRIERFPPANDGPHLPVILLHGADGLPGRRMAYRVLAEHLTGHGYLTFVPHYFDATPGQTRPNPLNPLNFAAWMTAVEKGIGHALAQPDVVAPGVALVGFSLGGYLATAVAAGDARVAAVVECSGGAAELFMPSVASMPPVLILHGGADPVIPVSEAHRLAQMLQEHGRPHELWIYPGCGHQIAGAELEDALRRSATFLRQHLNNGAT